MFLTTLKPLQKIVTAQDIQSSLYYLHVNCRNDEELQDELCSSQDQEQSQACGMSTERTEQVRRKPLALTLQSNTRNRQGLPSGTSPQLQQPAVASEQEPIVNGTNSQLLSLSTVPRRRLLGPRPLHQRLQSENNALLEMSPQSENIKSRRWSAQPGTIGPVMPSRQGLMQKEPRRDTAPRTSADSLKAANPSIVHQTDNHSTHSGCTTQSYVPRQDFEVEDEEVRSLSITLIRRDPASGHQWNIGKICSTSQAVSNSGKEKARKQLGNAISIEITTPGYSKFVDPNSTGSLPRSVDNINVPHDEHFPGGQNTKGHGVFRRLLQRSEHKYQGRSEQKQRPEQGPRADSARSSGQSMEAIDLDSETPVASPEHEPAKSRGYMFASPWNGLCEFHASVTGRALKCKHNRPSTSPVPVSELRFNLPSSHYHGHPFAEPPSPHGTSMEFKRSSFFSRQHMWRRSSREAHNDKILDREVETSDSLDLSLGQEYAGGGFGGKQAKLGKLIVENEGLKMLDLVVAANMGLWWGVYMESRSTS